MKIDVSEVKTFKACKRQWQLSSRNRFHMAPIATPPQFAFGTLFHESLAQLYLGVPLEKVMDMVRKEMHTDSEAALLAMIPGYYNNVLVNDLERFKVLDIEHHFEIAPTTSDGEPLFPLEVQKDAEGNTVYDAAGNPLMVSSVLIVGSIDMIVLDKEQNKIYGFEHKTCKNFRDATYLWMDEQPRVYTWALQQYVREYNVKQLRNWELEKQKLLIAGKDDDIPKPEPATLGGVYMNEVKKLLRKFDYQRTLCTYSDEDLDNFMRAFFSTCSHAKHMVDNNEYAAPQPSYFACQNCAFNTICMTYMYEDISKDAILEEFSEEYKVREEDHLNEKAERSTE